MPIKFILYTSSYTRITHQNIILIKSIIDLQPQKYIEYEYNKLIKS